MFKPGDKYIQFTVYGCVKRGIVAKVHESIITDTVNSVEYVSVSIITKDHQMLELDGSDGRIYRVINELSHDQVKNIMYLRNHLQDDENQCVLNI